MNKSLATLIAAKTIKHITVTRFVDGCSTQIILPILEAFNMTEDGQQIVVIGTENETFSFHDRDARITELNQNNSVWVIIPEEKEQVLISW